jgi:hypothetical protein
MRANKKKEKGEGANSKCPKIRLWWLLAFAFVWAHVGNLLLGAQTTQNKQSFISPETIGNTVKAIQRQPESSSSSSSSSSKDYPEVSGSGADVDKGTGDSFAFCLLIKDDNDLLNEWIAYHYHVLKLRHLVVAVDPSSETSPSSILQAWRDNFQLQVDEWTDQTYMPKFFLQGDFKRLPEDTVISDIPAKLPNGEKVAPKDLEKAFQKLNQHRYRQMTFLKQCMIHVKKQNRTWMAHVDTDEFVVINPNIRKKEGTVTNLALGQNTIFSFLKEKVKLNSKIVNWPCISMPRILFGAHKDDIIASNRTRFETLRWKYHAANAAKQNSNPKVIIDLSGVHFSELRHSWPKMASLHRPLVERCRTNAEMEDITKTRKLPLTVNHYIGSLDQYLARNDVRRSPTTYWKKAQVTDDSKDDDWIDGWLDSFVSTHGQAKVSTVLGGYMDAEKVKN